MFALHSHNVSVFCMKSVDDGPRPGKRGSKVGGEDPIPMGLHDASCSDWKSMIKWTLARGGGGRRASSPTLCSEKTVSFKHSANQVRG